jgi:negative regulator of genetic competence, sporulation and motility
MVVRALDYCTRQSASFLEEYARRMGSGEILAAIVEEHGKLLAADNAVDKLGILFAQTGS